MNKAKYEIVIKTRKMKSLLAHDINTQCLGPNMTLPLSPPFPLVQIRINIHSFLVPFVTGIHSPLNHAYS